jgi:hypothetical protein
VYIYFFLTINPVFFLPIYVISFCLRAPLLSNKTTRSRVEREKIFNFRKFSRLKDVKMAQNDKTEFLIFSGTEQFIKLPVFSRNVSG